MRRILRDILIIAATVSIIWFVYVRYGDVIFLTLFGEQPATMYVRSTPIAVSIADEQQERVQGLSGVEALGEFEGKLFVFPEEDYYSMWMKDMLIPIDIVWINNEMEIVHIENNVLPSTFPNSFVSDEPARFVLEVNAFFMDSEQIKEGDTVTLPPSALPADLIEVLQ